jgi:Phage tail lysozyme/Peptidase M15/D-alanyl-D-alanine carboxypeptidase
MADDLGHLTEQIKSVANDNKRVSEESVTSFRQAANDNTQSMANFAKDLNSYFSKQKNDLQNLTDAIETSVTETENVARKIDNTNQLLQNSINIQRQMLGELTRVSGTLNDLLTEEKSKKESGGPLGARAPNALGALGVLEALSELKSISSVLGKGGLFAGYIGAATAAIVALDKLDPLGSSNDKRTDTEKFNDASKMRNANMGKQSWMQWLLGQPGEGADPEANQIGQKTQSGGITNSQPKPRANGTYSASSAAQLASQAGATPEEAKTLGAIAMAESSGNITGGNQQAQNRNGSASQAMQFFQSKGWTKEQAAGIVGNLQVESVNFASDVISGKRRGDGGAAVGIGQWHSDRQKKFESIFGHSLIGAPFTEQLEFVNWELMHGYGGNWLKNAKSASEAADIFNKKFEISKNRNNPSAADNKQRISNANTLAGSANQTNNENQSSSPQQTNNQTQTSQQSAAPFSVTPKTTGSTATGGYKPTATNQTHPELTNGKNPQISNSEIDGGGLNFRSGVDKNINKGIADKVKQIEGMFGNLTITSGYRSPEHNTNVGGAKNSAHMRGNAVDVSFGGGEQATLKLIEAASKAGIGGIGVYRPGVVHLDTESRRAWGPTYHFDSVPGFAKKAIQAHLAGKWGEYDASAKGDKKEGEQEGGNSTVSNDSSQKISDGGAQQTNNQTHPELYNGQNPQQGATQISNSQITNNKNEGDYEEAVVGQNGGMTTLKTRSGKKYQVASAYAKKFFGFVDSLEKTGYKINSISGYANRNIAGTNTKSWHAKGMAIDINPDQNPVSFKPSKSKTDMPPGTDALAAKFGLGWGHMWTGKKQDSMHFSAGPNEGGEGSGYRKSQEGNQQTEQGSTSSSNSNEDSQRVASSEMQEAPGAVGSGGVQGAPVGGMSINPTMMLGSMIGGSFGGGRGAALGAGIGGIASLIGAALSAPAPGPMPQPKMAAAQPSTPTQMAAAPSVSPHSQAAVNRENIPEHTKNSSPDWSGLWDGLAPKFATLYANMA